MLPDLQADRIRAADLDAQIFELKRTLYTIRAEKALVQKRLDSYRYPVLTLPNEIISEIFVHFLPVYPACPPFTGIYSPTNLTQICRKWREIALATPLLWRAMRLACDPSYQEVDRRDMWCRMSGRCPLSLEAADKWALDDLAPQRARWEHLKVHVTSLYNIPDLFTPPMPLLRHLDLVFDDEDDDDEVSVFGEAPLLHSVILNDVAAKKFVLPWVQLTSLTLCATYGDCAAVLKRTPNLVHCNLDFTKRYGTTGTLPDFTFLHLESLVLADDYPNARDYMGTFILPSLRELQIAERLLGPTPPDSLASFISKSGCKLRKIRIRGPRIVSQDAYGAAFPLIQFSFNGKYVGAGTDVESNTDSSENDENDAENDTDSSDVEDD